MRTGMNMTIQDYFKRSGIKASSSMRVNQTVGDTVTGRNAFSQVMAEAQLSANVQANKVQTNEVQASKVQIDQQQGMSIRDYAARPVQSIRAFRTDQGAPKAENAKLPDASVPLNIDIPVQNIGPDKPSDTDSIQEAKLSEKDQILKSINAAAKTYNLSPALIRAVVQAESDYQVRAVSPAGAQGLMQLMPPTAKALGVQNPYDIDQNIDGGAKYLRQMLDRFDGDIKIALSAYNAGPGTVSKYNGNVPYAETRNYVERVMRFSRQFS